MKTCAENPTMQPRELQTSRQPHHIAMSTSSTVDPSCADLSLFRRQYLQLVEPRHILLPPAEVLAESSFQESLYNSVFAPDAIEHAPPPRYTFTVLKRLIPALEVLPPHLAPTCPLILVRQKATSTNPDHEASEDLYSLYTEYLCAPPPPTSPTARVAVTYTLPPPHLPITLQESPNLISGALTTGHRTWEAALALCEYLLVHKELLQSCQYLLELGAGTGMVALVAARLGVSRIMATDGDEAVVDTLAHNVKLNQLEEAVTCKKLWWGAEGNSSEFTAPPDVVLGADVVRTLARG